MFVMTDVIFHNTLQYFQVFEGLVKNRLEISGTNPEYYQSQYFLRILIWIKIFIRDPTYQVSYLITY